MTKKLTAQEIFDKSLNGILAQGGRAFIHGSGCAYITSDSTRCAIGVLIPEDVAEKWNSKCIGSLAYLDIIDQQTFHSMIESDLKSVGIDFNEHKKLLWDLQGAHDVGYDESQSFELQKVVFLRQMQEVAKAHNLDMKVPS